ncbi:hypothetical protein K2Y11_07255 [bacterium]|nr:hypothetical protein [bacterium]
MKRPLSLAGIATLTLLWGQISFLHAQVNASSTPIETKVPTGISAPEMESVFSDTERFLRPIPNEQLLILIHELEARGLTQAARELRGRLKTEDLVTTLLQMGQPAAALELIQQWKREEPDNPKSRKLEVAAQYAEGATELASRTVSLALARATPTDLPFLETLSELITYQSTHGKPASADGNPWGISFVGESGKFEAGKIAPIEKGKIKPATAKSLAELARLNPTSAATWALLGEFLNAEGLVPAAITSLERARALGYTPRILLEHARALSDYERNRRETLNQSIGGNSSSPAAPAESANGWENIFSRPRELAVIAIGGGIVLLILILQIRQWLRPGKR